jgi:hypothetical protein
MIRPAKWNISDSFLPPKKRLTQVANKKYRKGKESPDVI